MSLKFYGAMQA